MNLDALSVFPNLDTQRLLLRQLTPDDADAILAIFGDDKVTEFYDIDTMHGLQAARDLIGRLGKRFTERSGVRWGIESKADGQLIGTIGFNQVVPWAERAILGYDIARARWGQGIATESVRAAVGWGHETLGLKRVEAVVMLGNEASARVLLKAGFQEEGILRAYGKWKGLHHDLRMFSVLRA